MMMMTLGIYRPSGMLRSSKGDKATHMYSQLYSQGVTFLVPNRILLGMLNTDQEDAKLALAQEGTDALPPRIRKRGFGAINTVAFNVLGAFPEDSRHSPLVGTPEMTSLLHLLQGCAKTMTIGFVNDQLKCFAANNILT